MGLLMPAICAWCGTREKKGTRTVELSIHVAPRVKRKWRVTLPICKQCRAYSSKKKDAERQTYMRYVGITTVISLLVLGFFLEYKSFLETVAVTWVITFFLTLIVMSVTGLTKKLESQMTGPRPEGYASKSAEPCSMVGPKHLSFYNQEYHRRFSELNPDNVKW